MPQTKEQLRKLRQKYHLGEYRGSRTSPKRNRTKSHGRFNMARKRRSKRHSFGGSKSSTLMGTALGVGGYALYESFLQPKVAGTIGSGMILNVAELATGMWLSKKSGVVGNIGKAAVVLSAYKIVKPLLGQVASGASY